MKKSNPLKSDSNIELIMPLELNHYLDIGGCFVNTDFFKYKTGLYAGCIAVFSQEKVYQGDLVVILEKKTSDVIIGFYDEGLGLVVIERPFYHFGEFSPLMFDKDEVEVMGKIIGYCDPKPNKNGKYPVQVLQIKDDPDENEMPLIICRPFNF